MKTIVKNRAVFAALILLLLMSGCSSGMFNGTIVGDVSNSLSQFSDSSGDTTFSFTIRGGIYSHTVQPLTLNREPTDVRKNKESIGRINQIDYPLTTGLSIRVGKNGLGQVAKEHGMTTIYYADLEKWSALFGLWTMEVVHIYGQ